jgi:hypothetical protein
MATVPTVPTIRNQRWRRGSTNRRTYVLKESKSGPVINLANVTAIRMQIRTLANEAGELLLDLSLANGKITKTDGEGKIVVTAAAADTDGATWPKGFYDLKIWFSNGDEITYLEGTIVLSPNVTE